MKSFSSSNHGAVQWSLIRQLLASMILLIPFVALLVSFVGWYVVNTYTNPLMLEMKTIHDGLEEGYSYYQRHCNNDDITATSVEEITLKHVINNDTIHNHHQVAEASKEFTNLLMVHGSAVIPNLLQPETTTNLRNAIININSEQSVEEQFYVPEHDHRWSTNMGTREPRFDREDDIPTALKEIASHPVLHRSMEQVLGPNPAMIETTAITSEPGAVGQEWHYDTWNGGASLHYARSYMPVYSVFVFLQDTTADMGATGICPGTHMCAWNDIVDGERNDERCFSVEVEAGGAMMYHSQFAHIGHANVAQRLNETDKFDPSVRVVLVLTFASRPRPGLDPRQLPMGLTFANRWDLWGLTLRDVMKLDVQKWSALRSLEVFGGKDRGWGWIMGNLAVGITNQGRPSFHWLYDDRVWREIVYKLGAFNFLATSFYLLVSSMSRKRGWQKPNKVNAMHRRFFYGHTITVVIVCISLYLFSTTEWARMIRSGNRLRRVRFGLTPLYPADSEADSYVTDRPENEDILFEDRHDAFYLFQNSYFVDYHPGNRLFRSLVTDAASMYAHLPNDALLKSELIRTCIVKVLQDQHGMFLRQDDRGYLWTKMKDDEVLEVTRKALLNAKKPGLQMISKEIAFILSQCKYGDGGRRSSQKLNPGTAMSRRFTPQLMESLRKLLYLEPLGFDNGSDTGQRISRSIKSDGPDERLSRLKPSKGSRMMVITGLTTRNKMKNKDRSESETLTNQSKMFGVPQQIHGNVEAQEVVESTMRYVRSIQGEESFCATQESRKQCVNHHKNCAYWATIGLCSEHYMIKNCAPSCNICHLQPVNLPWLREQTKSFGVEQEIEALGTQQDKVWETINYMETMPQQIRETCTNHREDCTFLAVEDECEKNPHWMFENCAPSCSICHFQFKMLFEQIDSYGVPQKIIHTDKPIQAILLAMEETVEYMEMLSAQQHGLCANENELCVSLAADGECETNHVWMIENCSPSCKTCKLRPDLVQEQLVTYGVWQEFRDNEDPDQTLMAMQETVMYMEAMSSIVKKHCHNQHEHCAALAGHGECENNTSWMVENCSPSCMTCSLESEELQELMNLYGVAQEIMDSDDLENALMVMKQTERYMELIAENIQGNCLNRHSQCVAEAAIGACDKHPLWMTENCSPTCMACDLQPNELQEQIKTYGVAQEIQNAVKDETIVIMSKTMQYMQSNAPEMHVWCRNYHPSCASLAADNECDRNPNWMIENCAPSCQACGLLSTDLLPHLQEQIMVFGVKQEIGGNDDMQKMILIMRETIQYMESMSAEVRTQCLNSHQRCLSLAVSDGCWNEPPWMVKNCSPFCKTCHLQAAASKASQLKEDILSFGVEQEIGGRAEEMMQTQQVMDETKEYMEAISVEMRKECRNHNPMCASLAANHECEINQAWMVENCSPSCKTCHLLDAKQHQQKQSDQLQEQIARYGVQQVIEGHESTETERVMKETIMYMETLQGGEGNRCRNEHEMCALWASIGECDKNPWLHENCAPCCKMCHLMMEKQ